MGADKLQRHEVGRFGHADRAFGIADLQSAAALNVDSGGGELDPALGGLVADCQDAPTDDCYGADGGILVEIGLFTGAGADDDIAGTAARKRRISGVGALRPC